MSFSLSLLPLLFLYSLAQDPTCLHAPTATSRAFCNDIHKWDSRARKAGENEAEVSLAPGFTSNEAPRKATLETTVFDCRDIECVCKYLTGKDATKDCTYRGHVVKRAKRKEYRMLTDEERQKYHNAIVAIKNSGKYDQNTFTHKGHGAHAGPGFLPWHREFLKRFEFHLRAIDPTIALPYWDSTMDHALPNPKDSILWSEEFLGSVNEEGHVQDGAFKNWLTVKDKPLRRALGSANKSTLISENSLQILLNSPTVKHILAYTADAKKCPLDHYYVPEFVHGNVHIYVGGDMYTTESSSNDPAFFMHHTFIDYMWERWRQTKQTREERELQYPPADVRCSSAQHFPGTPMDPFDKYTMIDGLSNKYTDELYEYELRPTCTREKPDCGSKYLFCDLSTNAAPRCVSKVKVGGNCKGYKRGEEVCHRGVCRDNKCEAVESKEKPIENKKDYKPTPNMTISAKSVPEIQADCWNSHQCCAGWAEDGECEKNPNYMHGFCKASCNKCRPSKPLVDDCSDRHQFCAQWAKNGECDNNKEWMKENCRKSCNRCDRTRDQACLDSEKRAERYAIKNQNTLKAKCEDTGKCHDEFACCNVWAAQGRCRDEPDFMLCRCRTACGLCYPDYQYGACVDYHENCSKWSKRGECSKDPWMEQNCRKSCDMCGIVNHLSRAKCREPKNAGFLKHNGTVSKEIWGIPDGQRKAVPRTKY